LKNPDLPCNARGDGSREFGCGEPAIQFLVVRDDPENLRCSCRIHRHREPESSGVWREISYEEALILHVMQE
jgi:hypothetical protein